MAEILFESSQYFSPSCLPVERPEEPHPWFAIRVRSNYERTTSTILRGKGFDEFAALYPTKRRWSDRLKGMLVPLFPGYIFCRFNPLNRLPIVSTPGVVHIVGLGNEPEPVEESEIAALRTLVFSGLPACPWPFLREGQRVEVQYGSLAGVEGVVVRVKNHVRLVLSVTLLQRSVAVEIDRDWIRPM
ncbi:MAG: hypothetical protein HY822_12990 [Acidobacteria bacterium]|nr:hypothetical protein [Acidobacteriota bacterium]